MSLFEDTSLRLVYRGMVRGLGTPQCFLESPTSGNDWPWSRVPGANQAQASPAMNGVRRLRELRQISS